MSAAKTRDKHRALEYEGSGETDSPILVCPETPLIIADDIGAFLLYQSSHAVITPCR
jgi:hypothetical protein